ncbi:MAG: hypothetical protein RLO50_16295 [Azospirillaceae bacterium]
MTTQTIDMAALAGRASLLDERVRQRNRFEFISGGLASLILLVAGIATLAGATGTTDIVSGLGSLALVAGFAVIGSHILRLSQRARLPSLHLDGYAHYLARLSRERRLLGSAWAWYVGPLVPGFVMIYGSQLLPPDPNPAFALIGGGATFAVLIGVVVLNLRAAHRIDREICDLVAAGEDD